jgi:sulfur carrier protein ThiS
VYDIELEMTISLRYSPILKLEGPDESGKVETAAGTTVKDLLGRLGIPDGQQRYLLVYANDRKQTLSYTLRDGDAVQLFLPIGGG